MRLRPTLAGEVAAGGTGETVRGGALDPTEEMAGWVEGAPWPGKAFMLFDMGAAPAVAIPESACGS